MGISVHDICYLYMVSINFTDKVYDQNPRNLFDIDLLISLKVKLKDGVHQRLSS